MSVPHCWQANGVRCRGGDEAFEFFDQSDSGGVDVRPCALAGVEGCAEREEGVEEEE